MQRRAFLQALGGMAVSLTVAPALAQGRSRTRASLVRVVPPAYMRAARTAGVPPRLLYAIALQESAMAFGDEVAPWPWTLCVRGAPFRYRTYQDAVRAMSYAVRELGIRNVDCGPMQVNWGAHRDKLVSPEQGLDAYNNLAIGGRILRVNYAETGDWFKAAGWYHSVDQRRSRDYAEGVFRRVQAVRDGEVPV